MQFYPGILKLKRPGWNCCLVMTFLFFPLYFLGQETNSRASGRIILEDDKVGVAATAMLVHESTQDKYASISSNDGYFYFFNLKPGGPYTLVISSVGYDTLKKTNLFTHLTSDHFFQDNTEVADFFLHKKIVTLREVIVKAPNDRGTRSGIETNITG